MRCISIRQPWAWAILHAGRRVEDRSWSTTYRGPILLHAAKGCTVLEHASAASWMASVGLARYGATPSKQALLSCFGPETLPEVPLLADLPRGGIVARARLVGCVRESTSPWFVGPWGLVLEDVEPVPFVRWRGEMSLFEVPESELLEARP